MATKYLSQGVIRNKQILMHWKKRNEGGIKPQRGILSIKDWVIIVLSKRKEISSITCPFINIPFYSVIFHSFTHLATQVMFRWPANEGNCVKEEKITFKRSRTEIPSCLWNAMVSNMETDGVQNPVVRKKINKRQHRLRRRKNLGGGEGGPLELHTKTPSCTHVHTHTQTDSETLRRTQTHHTYTSSIFPTVQPTTLVKGRVRGWWRYGGTSVTSLLQCCAQCFWHT